MLTDFARHVNRQGVALIDFIAPHVAVLWKDWPREMTARLIIEGGALHEPESFEFAMSGQCPHCRRECLFINQNHPPLVEVEHFSQYTTRYTAWAVMQCVGCGEKILGAAEADRGGRECKYVAHYPMGLPNDYVDALIPDELKLVFQEALRCRWVISFQATVLMCRRCLQVSCDREGAQGKDLFNQIDDLAGKGTITRTLKEMAHRIRLLGKKGAHGDYSDIDATVTDTDADEAIVFMRNYLEFVYVLPAKLSPKQVNPQKMRYYQVNEARTREFAPRMSRRARSRPRFDSEIDFVLSVPHSLIARRERAYRKKVDANPNRRGPKRKVNPSASHGPVV